MKCLKCTCTASIHCRSYSKSHETLAAPNLAPSVHPMDSHTPGRGPAAISRSLQELHNGDMQSAAKPALSSTTNRPDDMETDGEIDVDDCDDCKYKKGGVCNTEIFRNN